MTTISNSHNSNSSRLVYLRDFIEVHMLKNFLEELKELYPDNDMDSFGIICLDAALFENRLRFILGHAGIDVVHVHGDEKYIFSRVPFPLTKDKMETLKTLRMAFKDALVNNLPKSVELTPEDTDRLQAANTGKERWDISNNILESQGFATSIKPLSYALTEESTNTTFTISYSRLGGIGVEQEFPVLRTRFLDKDNKPELSLTKIQDTLNVNEKLRKLHDKWIPFVGETLLVEEYNELVKDINAE